jgi:RNA polymerase sigma-70 factor (ECF subfamily)
MHMGLTETATHSRIESVYRTLGPRLWRAVYAYSGDRAVTDDAVAEAFVQALRRGDAIRSPERWLWRTSFRIAAGLLQDRRRWVEFDSSRAPVHQGDGAGGLVAELSELTPDQRACLVLHYYGGYPTAEISDIIGISPAAVRMSLTRGRRSLRKIMERSEAHD